MKNQAINTQIRVSDLHTSLLYFILVIIKLHKIFLRHYVHIHVSLY